MLYKCNAWLPCIFYQLGNTILVEGTIKMKEEFRLKKESICPYHIRNMKIWPFGWCLVTLLKRSKVLLFVCLFVC